MSKFELCVLAFALVASAVESVWAFRSYAAAREWAAYAAEFRCEGDCGEESACPYCRGE